jgi:ubiquinone/menaquinone biosynthesis C-methylase UbiE
MKKYLNNDRPTERFTNRVGDYKKHRPGYPQKLVTILVENEALPQNAIVADVGAGTGHWSRELLPHVRTLYAVEPNNEMRREAESAFESAPNYISIDGTAEATELHNHSVDLITAAQAFHWFDAEQARREFKRILKPGGHVALVWNVRDTEADEFQREYDNLLRTHIVDFKKTFARSASDEHIFRFYATQQVEIFVAANDQLFDLDSLLGRLMSSSYAPKPPSPIYDTLIQEMTALFNRHNQNGRVRFIYQSKLYLGQL